MAERISEQEIVKPAPLVISVDDPDSIFVKDNPNIIKTGQSGLNLGGYSSSRFFGTGSAGAVGASGANGASGATGPGGEVIIPPDVPSLADIEKIDFEEYPDPLTGVAKYKVIIKIRNSSREKINVEGVDARIANASGSVTYNLGTGTASGGTTGTTKSTYISNTTWYNATTTYNPSTKTIYSGPSLGSNAQYPSDGNGVPADSIVGGESYKIKSVWRKTQAEALAAAAIN